MQSNEANQMLNGAKRIGCASIAAAILVATLAFTFSSGPADARPDMVTASKPCGSCHPPNKPPGK